MLSLHTLLLMVWAACCAIQDWHSRTIANLLTIGPGLLALLYLSWNTYSWLGSPWQMTLAGVFCCLLLTLPGYLSHRLGAADVKMMLTLALATDLKVLIYSFIGAGLVLFIWFLVQFKSQPKHDSQQPLRQHKKPYAPAVFIGLAGALLLNP